MPSTALIVFKRRTFFLPKTGASIPQGPVRMRAAVVSVFNSTKKSVLTWQKANELVNSIDFGDFGLDFGKLAEGLVNESSIHNALWVIDAVAFVAKILLYEIYVSAPNCT